ncbi:MAG: copper chaperone PCu(A)C [Spongiibacteraceae bacterium]
MKNLSAVSLLLGGLLACTLARADALQIREGYVRELPPGQSTSAAYMDVVNNSNRPVAIVAAVSDVSQSAEVHEHKHADGAMSMAQVRRLVIPAHDHVQFAPGGYHLMLINLKRSLRAGDNVKITLLDEEGKAYSAQIPVVKMLGVGK